MSQWLNRIVKFSVLFAFIVILLGAYTRLKDAGLGCPDWPGCYGQIFAPTTQNTILEANQLFPETPVEVGKAHIEMTHRYFASTLGLLILAILFFRIKLREHPVPKWLPFCLIGLVIFQGLLGMWTVTLKLLPMIVMGHLLGGFLTLSLLWLTFLYSKHKPIKVNSNAPTKLAKITLGIVFIQIFLGGWTSANYAAIICPDFPLCQGQWWPPALSDALNLFSGWGEQHPATSMHNDARVSVQLLHRFGALFTTLFVTALIFQLAKFKRNLKDAGSILKIRKANITLMIILSVQLALGVSNILFLAPLPIAVLHNGVGALLLLTLITVNYLLKNVKHS